MNLSEIIDSTPIKINSKKIERDERADFSSLKKIFTKLNEAWLNDEVPLKRLETAFLEAEKKLIALKKWCVRVTLASKDFITRPYTKSWVRNPRMETD